MPFTNNELIFKKEKSKIKTVVLILAVGFFVLSLFNIAFCTKNSCRTSIEVFLIGWLAIPTGGAAFSWLANPFLLTACILLLNNIKFAWLFGLIAFAFSLLFLQYDTIIENEAGQYNAIIKIGLGYWLWLLSCFTTFIGGLVIYILKFRST
jgi:hypothetical protein